MKCLLIFGVNRVIHPRTRELSFSWTWYSISTSLITRRRSRLWPASNNKHGNERIGPKLGVFLLNCSSVSTDWVLITPLLLASRYCTASIPAIPNGALDLSSRYLANDGGWFRMTCRFSNWAQISRIADHRGTFRRFISVGDVVYFLECLVFQKDKSHQIKIVPLR